MIAPADRSRAAARCYTRLPRAGGGCCRQGVVGGVPGGAAGPEKLEALGRGGVGGVPGGKGCDQIALHASRLLFKSKVAIAGLGCYCRSGLLLQRTCGIAV